MAVTAILALAVNSPAALAAFCGFDAVIDCPSPALLSLLWDSTRTNVSFGISIFGGSWFLLLTSLVLVYRFIRLVGYVALSFLLYNRWSW